MCVAVLCADALLRLLLPDINCAGASPTVFFLCVACVCTSVRSLFLLSSSLLFGALRHSLAWRVCVVPGFWAEGRKAALACLLCFGHDAFAARYCVIDLVTVCSPMK